MSNENDHARNTFHGVVDDKSRNVSLYTMIDYFERIFYGIFLCNGLAQMLDLFGLISCFFLFSIFVYIYVYIGTF